MIYNWEALVPAMLDSTSSRRRRAAVFHASMAQVLRQQALALREEYAVNRVSLSGGVFQNRVLTGQALALLEDDGFEVYLPERVPVNDAGISFGQVIEYGLSK